MKILLQPAPHEEAARFIAGKPAVGRAVFDGLLPELKARAFTIAGVESADTLQRARDLIAALPQGADWATQKAQLLGEISPWLVDDNADPETREKQVEAAARRAETLMRLHGFQAYAAADWQVMDRQRDAFPFWMYQTFGDGRVRPAHAALNGLTLPADHPFWKDHFPPWDWGCRCQVVPVTAPEAAEAARAKPGSGAGWAPGPEALKRMEQTGMLDLGDGKPVDIRSPRAKAAAAGEDPAAKFGWDPGDLRLPLEALKARYDAETWGAFEAMARSVALDAGGRKVSLWDWLGGSPIVTGATPSAPKAVTLASTLQKLGLAGKAEWNERDIRRLWRELKEDAPAKAGAVIAKVVGAQKSGVFSERSILRMVQSVVGVVPPKVLAALPKLTVRLDPAVRGVLGSYRGGTLTLYHRAIQRYAADGLKPAARGTLFHEMMHWVHDDAPQWYKKRVAELYARRTAGDTAVPYGSGGLLRRDRWWRDYAGRQYPWEAKAQGLEVASTHFELLANPRKMATVIRDYPNGYTVPENLKTVLEVFFEQP